MNIYPHCPYCRGTNIKRYGKYKNEQRYWCRNCKRKFTGKTIAHTKIAKIWAEDLRKAGVDIKTIAQRIGQKFGGNIHFTTIYRWGLSKPHCPHCGCSSLVREGRGWCCILCARSFSGFGRKYIAEQREKLVVGGKNG